MSDESNKEKEKNLNPNESNEDLSLKQKNNSNSNKTEEEKKMSLDKENNTIFSPIKNNTETMGFNSMIFSNKSRNIFGSKMSKDSKYSTHYTVNNVCFNSTSIPNLKSFCPNYNRLIFLNKRKHTFTKSNKDTISSSNSNVHNKQKKNNFNNMTTIPKDILVKSIPLSSHSTLKSLEKDYCIPYSKMKNVFSILPTIIISKANSNSKSKDKNVNNQFINKSKANTLDKYIRSQKGYSKFSNNINIKKMKLKKIFTLGINQNNNIFPLNTINNELPKKNEIINLGCKYYENIKDPEAEKRDNYKERLETLILEDKLKKRKKKGITLPKNCNDYLIFSKNKRMTFYKGLVQKTVDNAFNTKNKLNHLFDGIRNGCNLFDNWNSKENEDNLYDK